MGVFRTLVFVAALAGSVARAADRDDLYVEVLGGANLSTPVQPQGSVVFGYCPFDELGVGFVFDQIGNTTQQFGADARWMIEPLEVHGSIGFQRFSDVANSSIDIHGVLTVGGSYLMALTSSMAFLADLKYQVVIPGKGSVFAGLGGRVVF